MRVVTESSIVISCFIISIGAKWRESTVAVKMFKIEGLNETHIRDFLSECHAMEVIIHI